MAVGSPRLAAHLHHGRGWQLARALQHGDGGLAGNSSRQQLCRQEATAVSPAARQDTVGGISARCVRLLAGSTAGGISMLALLDGSRAVEAGRMSAAQQSGAQQAPPQAGSRQMARSEQLARRRKAGGQEHSRHHGRLHLVKRQKASSREHDSTSGGRQRKASQPASQPGRARRRLRSSNR